MSHMESSRGEATLQSATFEVEFCTATVAQRHEVAVKVCTRVSFKAYTLSQQDRTKTRNGLGNGSIKLRFVAFQVVERAFTIVV